MLLRKAVRAVWENKKAYAACIALIFVGVLVYVSMSVASATLVASADKYYKDCRLADVFAQVKAIPLNAVEGLRRVEGVDDVIGRAVYDARVLIPGNDKVITLRLTSVDTERVGTPINGYVFNGTDFSNGSDVMVSDDFLNAHGLRVGDTISFAVNGREKAFNICASVQSPEYVYAMKSENEIMPDPETFGYGFMTQENLFALTSKFGAYNDICFTLTPGARFEDVRVGLEDELKKYEILSLIPRKDQMSYNVMEMELTQIANMSTSLPAMFMLMAIMVLYLMLKRVIEQERTQIGTMKAFGYSNTSILLHYMSYGVVTGLVGGILGVVLGWLLADGMLDLYATYFKFPETVKTFTPLPAFGGMGLAVFAGAVGAYFGAGKMIKLNPAEAMRPPAPSNVKSDILRALPLFAKMLSSTGTMAIRSLSRNKVRSAIIMLGVSISFALLVFSGSAGTMVDDMLYSQYTKIQLYDAKIAFDENQDYTQALESAFSLDYVEEAEVILEIPFEMKFENRKTGVVITGLTQNSRLYHIYDNVSGQNYDPPEDGIIINDVLAKKLGLKRGDSVYLASPLFRDDLKIPISDVVVTNVAFAAYMDLDALSRLCNVKRTASAVVVKSSNMQAVKDALRSAENVAAIDDVQYTLSSYKKQFEPYNILFFLLEAVSAAITFAIIYNTSNISLSERKREFATLRVIGMHAREVNAIMNFEYWVLTAGGMALGVPLAWLLKQGMADSIASDLFTMPTFTPLSAYIAGVVGCVAAVWLSNYSALASIKKFDIVEVLKERE